MRDNHIRARQRQFRERLVSQSLKIGSQSDILADVIGLVAQFLYDARVFAERQPAARPPLCGANADYMVRVCVVLDEPRLIERQPADTVAMTEAGVCWQERSPDPPMVGYFVEIGLRTEPMEVIGTLERVISDGAIHWGRTKWHEVSATTRLSRTIRRNVRPMTRDGVWYLGERTYFSSWF